MRILVLSEFCVPLVFHVLSDATVEHIKAGFPGRTSAVPVPCVASTGLMVANNETTVDARHLLYDRLQASLKARWVGTSVGQRDSGLTHERLAAAG